MRGMLWLTILGGCHEYGLNTYDKDNLIGDREDTTWVPSARQQESQIR